MEIIKSILKNRWFIFAALTVLVQQLMVGTGSYLIGNIASEITQFKFSYNKIGILIFCLLLSGSFVNLIASYFTAKAQKSILFQYLNRYFVANYNQPNAWRNVSLKSNRHDLMNREGQDSIAQFTHFTIDALATLLNIIFNTISVILVLNWSLGLSLCIAGGLGLLIIHISDKRIRQNSHQEMQSQNQLNGYLSKSWDNIVLGNKFFYQRWTNNFNQLFKIAERNFITRATTNSFVNATASFITTGIVVGMIFYQILTNQSNVALISSLLVMFPRCLQIVMHMQIIQSYWTQWKHLSQKVEQTEATIKPLALMSDNANKYIQHQQIEVISNQKLILSSELQEQIKQNPSGRYTIMGNNGVGKSSLLIDLKAKLDEEALFIPTQNQLDINDDFNSHSLSSGETLLKTLELIKNQSTEKFLLLDEWDAHLSLENKIKINAEIEELSQTRIIIEVRHSGINLKSHFKESFA